MFALIQTLYAYNSWAVAKLLDALEQLTPEELAAPGCSGHGSIRDTLAHFMGTQWGWFSWFDGSMTVAQSYSLKISGDSIDTIAKADAGDEKAQIRRNRRGPAGGTAPDRSPLYLGSCAGRSEL